MSKYQLNQAANKLLKKAGYSYDGTIRNSVSRSQTRFEKRVVIKVPMGGQPR